MLEKVDRVVMLKDFYGPLLTEKQQEVLRLYYEDDWSLVEIAQSYSISRQAVYDLIRRAERSLEDYEKRLGLVGKFMLDKRLWQQVKELLSGEVDKGKLEEAKALIGEMNL